MNTRVCTRGVCALPVLVAAALAAWPAPAADLVTPEDHITPLAGLLPFAYYPSTNELDVAFDRAGALVREAFADPAPARMVEDAQPGLAYAYYEHNPWQWNSDLPDFADFTPKATGVLGNLNPRELTTLGSGWGAVYVGYIDVPQDGLYSFYVRPFAKGRLMINGRQIVETVRYGAYNWRGGAISLRAGRHAIAFEQLGWGEWKNHELPPETLRIDGPGLPYQPLPDRILSHTPAQAREPRAPQVQHADESPATQVPETLDSVEVRVVGLHGGSVLARGSLELDEQGRAQGRMSLPDLPDGQYTVEFGFGGQSIRALSHFRRIHFPWEGNTLGIEEKVYPPFERVRVDGAQVSVSDRTYTLNAFGAIDQVIAKDQPLLAQPMRLVCQTADGEQAFRVIQPVRGYSPQVDRAVFNAAAETDVIAVNTTSTIEEDGCIRVAMTLSPGRVPGMIERLWLEVSLDDEQVPLFHYVANNNLRHNYAGATPRGGRIRWIIPDQSGLHAWPAIPPTWEADPGPDDGMIWNALQTNTNQYRVDEQWVERYRGTGHENTRDLDNFVPYIWLGSAERGLAWFGDTDRHYRGRHDQPVQTLSREGDRVVLRIYFLQQPTRIVEPFTITYGLMASPTKPIPANWRSEPVPGGAGLPVVCWGGYWCADKYPDNRDFSVVDLRQEARRRDQRNQVPWSQEMLDELAYREQTRLWIDSDVLGYPWDQAVQHWYGQNATYFEEYIIRQRSEEWQVFQDEWAVQSFNRFLGTDAHWYVGATPRSYRDFVLYYANEWLKRGVSIYFDNTFPKVDRNHYANGFHGRTFTMWSQRDYHRRLYKLLSRYNQRDPEWPLHFTVHMTNTQVLPHTTWATATLDLEQGYRVSPDGKELPFPPEYTLAVTLGRQVGVTPHVMHPLRNIGRFTIADRTLTPRQEINDWGMHAVHELAHPWYWRETWFDPTTRAHDYRKLFLEEFDYGKPGTTVHNYWADKPYLHVDHPKVRWIVLLREQEPRGLLVLQSYSPQALNCSIKLPAITALMDAETGEYTKTDERGQIILNLPEDYSTRVFVFSNSRESLPQKPLIPRAGAP